MLPLTLHSPWWTGSLKKTKMVDLQLNWEALWPDTSLFGDEPVDTININDFLNNEKANSKGNHAIPSNPGLAWFDEKVDLSVLDNPDSLLNHPNETQPLMEDESALLLGLLGDSFDPSYFTADVFKNGEIDFSKEFDVESFITESASSEILDTHLASPLCNSLHVNSPEICRVQSPASPFSDISDAPEESSHALQSPESHSETSEFANSLDSPEVHVSVCDNVASSPAWEPVVSIEEVSKSMRKRKFVNNDGTRPKVVKVMFPEDVLVRAPKSSGSRERKKVQNKEAAARYRIKKRMEEKVLSDEIDVLELQKKKLQENHDQLKSEIKYLKSLMCEMLVKKGIMK